MTGPRRLRHLSGDEIELWRSVAQTVAPREGSILPSLPSSPPTENRKITEAPKHRSAPPSYVPSQSRPRVAAPPLAPLERQFRKKVTRGLIGLERIMDLHGLNQAEAHRTLRGFLRTAQADGLRLVLVVTGKGRRAHLSGLDGVADAGVLRRAVPHWLREADLRTVVLGFEEASQPHGGAGALYVRLRQRRD